jgi:hypothetical protein
VPVPEHSSLVPAEHEQDGNVCDDHEELYLGLCYTKCSALTGGTHPFRASAFSCCETSPCGMNALRMRTASILPCSGFDTSKVNGDSGCPHAPGVCLTDEELFLGECYETCSKLTIGAYPNRVAPATCCKSEGLACFDPLNDWTAAQLDVGGGAGDHDGETPHNSHPPLKSLTETKKKIATPSPTRGAVNNARRVPPTSVTPDEHMHDGNPCDDSEELFMGLCYTKCADLTEGAYMTRKSAFTCCEQPNCGANLFKMKTSSILPCKGYDVSSADGGTACPHAVGTCLKDEELFGGECFEKCSVLTDGTHPNRVGAATCCKTHGVRCLDPFNDWTAKSFAAGGGAGDDDSQTPQGAHYPLQRLTEAMA